MVVLVLLVLGIVGAVVVADVHAFYRAIARLFVGVVVTM